MRGVSKPADDGNGGQARRSHNTVDGRIEGTLVQTGSIGGGVHFHQPLGMARVIPRQLPASVLHFTGRQVEVEVLDQLLGEVGQSTDAVVISAIAGTAGIGKSALAIHWARSVSGKFPDGQLYVNLGGFDPRGTPMQPAEAIRGFLDAFQVPAEIIPVGIDAQAALYRSLLADKRVLVILDNAGDLEQIRLLLPGSSTCLAIITSRNQLAGLVATAGARPIILDVLTDRDTTALLARHLGEERVAAEPEAVAELIKHCARLPLALVILAARAAEHPGFPLSALAAEVADEESRLDAFDLGGIGGSVRAVFSWSYRTLTADAARLFRLLGQHPGPDVGQQVAASLAGITFPQARGLLTELCRAYLLEEHHPGRFRFHDLLRAYAAEQAVAQEGGKEQAAAGLRALDFYLHTSFAADRQLDPARTPIELTALQQGVTPRDIKDYRQALSWFTAEHANLLAVTEYAASVGLDTYAWQLPWTLATYFYWRAHWHDVASSQQIALGAALRLSDPVAQVRAYRGIGRAYTRLGHLEDAVVHLTKALALCQELDDEAGQAATHHALSVVFDRQSRHEVALVHAQHALRLSRATGNTAREARALNDAGWCHARLGDFEEAVDLCRQAEHLFEELGDQHGEAKTLDSLGYALHHLGRRDEAVVCYQRSVALHRHLANRYSEAATLVRLGDTYAVVGDQHAARRSWQEALATFAELNQPEAREVQAKLSRLS
jgi:tetratricopeptide (TPR) repeat protein